MKCVLLLSSFLISQIFYSQEIVGNTDFNPVDRIAIKNVIDAYGVYWDTNQLDKWMSLFTEDAIDSRILNKKESETKIKANFKMYQERMEYFVKNKMQRRHMMANTLFLSQTNSSVDVEQYMMLITTNSNSNTDLDWAQPDKSKLNKPNKSSNAPKVNLPSYTSKASKQ